MHRWSLIGAGTLAFCAAHAVEPRETPLSVATVPYADGKSRLTVDWGAQGDDLAREPQQVRTEHQQLVAWLTSPDVVKRLTEMQADSAKQEHATATAAAQAWAEHRQVDEQAIDFEQGARAVRQVELPAWMRSLPADVRGVVCVGLLDARQESHIAWALAMRRRKPEAHLFALGWSSSAALAEVNRQYPALQLQVVKTTGFRASSAWMTDYQATTLPALATVAGDHLVIDEGLP